MLFLALPLLIFGCNSAANDDPAPATHKGELKQFHELYAEYIKKNQTPPKQVSDLDRMEYDMVYPSLIGAIKSGRYVMVWGVDLNANGGAVVAYEKDAPTQGGWVVTADGTPRQMSADQLQSALKK